MDAVQRTKTHEKYHVLVERAAKAGSIAVAVAHPCDAVSLEGAVEAARMKLIRPILVGPQARIREVPAANGIDISGLPMVDAALGTSVTVDAILDGATDIAIPAGIQPGATIVLRGHGMPQVRTGARGDLHAHIEVVVPERLDNQDIELLRKFKEHRDRETAEVRSANAPQSGGLFSRLRETFTGR